jgi:hypothetical protein
MSGQAIRRRRGARRAVRDRQVRQAVNARRELANPRVGRAWINGREVGGVDSRYRHLADSYD